MFGTGIMVFFSNSNINLVWSIKILGGLKFKFENELEPPPPIVELSERDSTWQVCNPVKKIIVLSLRINLQGNMVSLL